ncbi:MAG: right-handed parallel beta-helix repeat-containing protein, partial [Candidatus Omnitrophota bacterium]|nr:right-handed parallel beta-helix repeat-containing protein [Candidatus Omnitrophota bacterium]
MDPRFIKPANGNFYMEFDSPAYGKGRSLEFVTETLSGGAVQTLDSFGNILKEEKPGEYTEIYHYSSGALGGSVKTLADGEKEYYDASKKLIYSITSTGEKTIYAGAGYYYTAIQDAINAASGGDTVSIAAGTYTLSAGITILYNNIEIKGAGSGNTIIDGSSISDAITINGSTVTMEGVTVRGALNNNIYVLGQGVFTIEDSTVEGAGSTNIWVEDWSTATITNCKIKDATAQGVFAQWGSVVNIEDSEIWNNNVGIYAADAYLSAVNNTIAGNTTTGIRDESIGSESVINHNIVAFNGTGIQSIAGTAIDYNDVYGNTITGYSGCVAGANDIAADPKFIDRLEGNFFLEFDSPVLLAGMGAISQNDYVAVAPDANTTEWYDNANHIIRKALINPNVTIVYHYADGVINGYSKYDSASVLIESAVYYISGQYSGRLSQRTDGATGNIYNYTYETGSVCGETRELVTITLQGSAEVTKYDFLTYNFNLFTGHMVWKNDGAGNVTTYNYNNTTEWELNDYVVLHADASREAFDVNGKLVYSITAGGQKTIHVGADKHFTQISQAVQSAASGDIV